MESIFSTSFLNTADIFFGSWPILSLAILGVAFAIRGETTILVSAYLAKMGVLSWGIIASVAFVGIVGVDIAAYFFGAASRGTELGDKINDRFPKFRAVQGYLKTNAEKLIFISKFTAGLTMITMFTSGWTGIKFKRFFKIQIFTAVVWGAIMGGLSYFLIEGLGYLQAENIFEKIEIAILILAALFIGGEIFLQKAVRKKYKSEKEEGLDVSE